MKTTIGWLKAKGFFMSDLEAKRADIVAVYSGNQIISTWEGKNAWQHARREVRARAYHEEQSGGFTRGACGWDSDLRLYIAGAHWCAALEAS